MAEEEKTKAMEQQKKNKKHTRIDGAILILFAARNFSLKEVRQLDGDGVWLRYAFNNAKKL